MPISTALHDKLVAVRSALKAVEAEYPDDKALKVLHARMFEALKQAKSEEMTTDDQFQTLAGTDKTGD